MINNKPLNRRFLLKLSGETLMGEQAFGIEPAASHEIATHLFHMHQSGIELAIVIGGGNIFRGLTLKSEGMKRTPADHMGMLATLMNGIALQESLEKMGASVCVMSALECPKVVESYQWEKANRYLKQGKIVIFVGGTGNSYFTTDTAAALRASEINATVLIKATKVDGIYDKDPLKHVDAKKYRVLTYSQVLAENLQVMDATAVALCRANRIPIFVFDMMRLHCETIEQVLANDAQGTWVKE